MTSTTHNNNTTKPVRDELNEYAYDAATAGLAYSVTTRTTGLSVKVGGCLYVWRGRCVLDWRIVLCVLDWTADYLPRALFVCHFLGPNKDDDPFTYTYTHTHVDSHTPPHL